MVHSARRADSAYRCRKRLSEPYPEPEDLDEPHSAAQPSGFLTVQESAEMCQCPMNKRSVTPRFCLLAPGLSDFGDKQLVCSVGG
jgi:hypothetical protein